MTDMNAELPNVLCKTQPGCLAQLSEQVAVAPGTKTDEESLKQQLTVLMAILVGLMHNVMSGDVIYFSIAHARNLCPNISDEEFEKISSNFMRIAKQSRSRNPLSRMF
jgi:hypothetical protein